MVAASRTASVVPTREMSVMRGVMESRRAARSPAGGVSSRVPSRWTRRRVRKAASREGMR